MQDDAPPVAAERNITIGTAERSVTAGAAERNGALRGAGEATEEGAAA